MTVLTEAQIEALPAILSRAEGAVKVEVSPWNSWGTVYVRALRKDGEVVSETVMMADGRSNPWTGDIGDLIESVMTGSQNEPWLSGPTA